MTPERWQQVKDVLNGALELAPEERPAFLDQACSKDHSLRRDVESLLSSADRADPGLLSSPRSDFKPTLDDLATVTYQQSQANGFTPGTVVADRYRVVSLLGRGGMGEVYGADDLKLVQRVALKFLPAARGRSSSWRDQFYAEVRMAQQVSHPNVSRVYDIGESEGRLFLSMEFVDGEDLASLLRRIGRLPDDKAVEIAQQLRAGLLAPK
jgi:hypothetical protein